MKLIVELDRRFVTIERNEGTVRLPFSHPEAFGAISHAWLQCGWDAKHVYTFTWLGRPIIQLPEDLLRIQEAIYSIKPDVVLETGIAHGGSLIFYASICHAMGRGRVIGVDVALRPVNREALAAHGLSSYISIVEGSSIDPAVVRRVYQMVRPGETTLVVLDSDHSRAHVLGELEAYAGLVTQGSYLVAADGIMKDLAGAPRSAPDWAENNPWAAARAFLDRHPEFELHEPARLFDESVAATPSPTYWPGAWLRRR
jgi:cephalosporin hydroxylase